PDMPRQQEKAFSICNLYAFDWLQRDGLRFKGGTQCCLDISRWLLAVKILKVCMAAKAHYHSGEIALRICVHKYDSLPLLRKHPAQVESGGGLRYATLVVEERNALHGSPLCFGLPQLAPL